MTRRRAVPGLLACAAVLGSCGTAAAPLATPAPVAPTATTVRTTAGTWTTLPMGDPSDPVDTFWQLLERPAGGGPWRDVTTGVDTATNAGLVVSGDAGTLTAAVPPSQLLHFSPVVSTTDAVRWASQPPAPSISAGAASVTTSADGTDAVSAGGGSVLRHAGGSWVPVVQRGALRGRSGCRPGALTSVAGAGSATYVGGTCAGGAVGLWESEAGGWADVAPILPTGTPSGTEVIGLRSTAAGLAAVITTGQSSVIAALRSSDGTWQLSAALHASGVRSEAQTAAGGVTITYGTDAVATWEPGSPWSVAPTPPAGTVDAFVDGDGSTSALAATPVARSTTVTVWSLTPGSSSWQRQQVLDVPVPFGSSG